MGLGGMKEGGGGGGGREFKDWKNRLDVEDSASRGCCKKKNEGTKEVRSENGMRRERLCVRMVERQWQGRREKRAFGGAGGKSLIKWQLIQ